MELLWDFSSAYIIILHSNLFKRLEIVLDEEEIALLKVIFSRFTVKLGKESFIINKDVFQVSIISQALFNIYYDSLYREILQGYWRGYWENTRICWWPFGSLFEMFLEFVPRVGSQTFLEDQSFLWKHSCRVWVSLPWFVINQKPILPVQLDMIDEKVHFQVIKLWPVLKPFSLDERIYLLTIVVHPLFEMLIFPQRSWGALLIGKTYIAWYVRLLRSLVYELGRLTIRQWTVSWALTSMLALKMLLITEFKWQAKKDNKLSKFHSKGFKWKTLLCICVNYGSSSTLKPLCVHFARLGWIHHLRESYEVSVPEIRSSLTLWKRSQLRDSVSSWWRWITSKWQAICFTQILWI